MAREAVQALGTMALFAALALAGFGLARRADGRASAYPVGVVTDDPSASGSPVAPPAPPPPGEWLVDGFNVLNVALLRGRSREGWWRASARAQLLEQVRALESRGAEIWVAFDGPRPATEGSDAVETGRVHVVFAPSADRWLLERLRRAPDPGRVAVVTADRRLADRARARGARVVPPRAFLESSEAGLPQAPGAERS